MTSAGDVDPPKDTRADLLSAWEQRIDAHESPLAALASLLAGGSKERVSLFHREGSMAGDYRLVRVLGSGGMGVTYAARGSDGSYAAVKLMEGMQGTARQRFEHECRILSTLSHPAVARYRAHGVLDDSCGYLAMDLVRGVELEVLLLDALLPEPPADGPVALLLHGIEARGEAVLHSVRYQRRLLRLLASVAEGLHHVHEAGVVHRDIKPANILVRPDLEPVLIDFGLSRDLLQKVSLTRSNVALGTLAYMAPEQFGRDPGAVDRRSDIFALGLVLYRAMCGTDLRVEAGELLRTVQRPFLLAAQQSREVSMPVQAILYRCLGLRKDQRYATAALLAADLRAAAAGEPVVARRPGVMARHWRSPWRSLSVAVGLLLLACLLAGALWPRPVATLVLRPVYEPWDDVVVRLDDGPSQSLGHLRTTPGEHRVVVEAPGAMPWRRTVTLPDGITFLPVPLAPRAREGEPLALQEPGDDAAVVLFTSSGVVFDEKSQVLDERYVDGRRIGADGSAWSLWNIQHPGVVTLVAKSGDGALQERIQFLAESGVQDVHLLPVWLRRVPGSIRRTWSTVCSPLPEGTTLLPGPGATRWAGQQARGVFDGRGWQAAAAFTASAAGQWTEVAMVSHFDVPVRSLVALLSAEASFGGELQVDWRLDDAAWQPWQMHGTDSGVVKCEPFLEVAPGGDGARIFTLRVRMRQQSAPFDVASVRAFLSRVCGPRLREEPPCFALVADAAPGSAAATDCEPLAAGGSRFWRELPQNKVEVWRLAEQPRAMWTPEVFIDNPRREVIHGGLLSALGNDAIGVSSQGHGAMPFSVFDRHARRRLLLPPPVESDLTWRGDALFGQTAVLVPDCSGDGVDDLALGSPSATLLGNQNAGVVHVFDGASGTQLFRRQLHELLTGSPHPDHMFGHELSAMGDDRWLLGAPQWSAGSGLQHQGRIECRSIQRDELVWSLTGNATEARLTVAAVLQDVDGDGESDLLTSDATGITQDAKSATGPSLLELRSGHDGKPVHSWLLPAHSSRQMVVLRAPDRLHLLVSCDDRQNPHPRAWLQLLAIEKVAPPRLTVAGVRHQPLDLWSPSMASDYSACAVGDLDGDGYEDAGIGTPSYSDAGVLRGGVLFVSGKDLHPFAFVPGPEPGWWFGKSLAWLPPHDAESACLYVQSQWRDESEVGIGKIWAIPLPTK